MTSEADPFSAWYAGELAGGEVRPPAAASPSYALSGWWARAGAVLLDDLVLLVPIIVLIVALHQYHVTHYITIYGTVGTPTTVTNGGGFDGLLWLAYAAVLLARAGARNGQTLGKPSPPSSGYMCSLTTSGLSGTVRTAHCTTGWPART